MNRLEFLTREAQRARLRLTFKTQFVGNQAGVIELPLNNWRPASAFTVGACHIKVSGAAPLPEVVVFRFDRGIQRVEGDTLLMRPVGYSDTKSFIGYSENVSQVFFGIEYTDLGIGNTHTVDVIMEICLGGADDNT